MKKKLLVWLYGLALASFSIFILLDTFVLPKNVVSLDALEQNVLVQAETKESIDLEESEKQVIESDQKSSAFDSNQSHENNGDANANTNNDVNNSAEIISTENYYQDENITISIEERTVENTQVYIADVQVSDPGYLKAGLAQNSFGQNLSAPTSQIASENGAILAINGDYYGFRDGGYVLRNGYLYRESQSRNLGEDLVIDANGNFFIINESEVSAADLANSGARQIFSFGPALIKDGTLNVNENSEVSQSMRSNPRTAIGQIGENHYVLIVSDGRSQESEGLSLYELASLMMELGCQNAYNLDGGGSSTMVFQGEVINNPTSGNRSGERSVSDIVYIG